MSPSGARLYDRCARGAHHLCVFRYDKSRFANLPRARFLAALSAGGIPASLGYSPLNMEPYITDAIRAAILPRVSQIRAGRLVKPDHLRAERPTLPATVWFTQNLLLADRAPMDQVAAAIGRVHAHAAAFAKA
jgi:perosamine synthetase